MSVSKEGISLPGEAEDKCCFCVPIKPGVYIIGVFMILWAVEAVLTALTWIGTSGLFIYGVIQAASAAPILLGAWYYIAFFREDNADTRNGLAKACMMVILSSIISVGVAVVMMIGGFGFSVVMSAIISAGIVSFVYFYYAGVCKRYASQI